MTQVGIDDFDAFFSAKLTTVIPTRGSGDWRPQP